MENLIKFPFQVDGFVASGMIYFNEINLRQSLGSIFTHISKKYFEERKLKLNLMKYDDYLKIKENLNIKLDLLREIVSIPTVSV